MGFAIPSNVATALLDQQGIGLLQSGPQNALSGPEIARKTTPSVLLVKVEFGGGSSSGQQHVVEYSGMFTSQVEVGERRMPTAFGSVSGRGKLLVDQFDPTK